MVKHLTTPHSHLQITLWQFLLWVTAMCVVCALAQGIINHLHYVDAKDGSTPPDVIGRSLFFGFLILAAFVGLMLGPPLCFFVALWRSGRRAVGAKRTLVAGAFSSADYLAGYIPRAGWPSNNTALPSRPARPRTFRLTCGILALYGLSIGPAAALVQYCPRLMPYVEWIYAPVGYIAGFSKFLADALQAYTAWWAP